ncbi:MAG: FAD-binding oxidoreductase, partial [Candidatus Omnitrophica bacterium]|nr:FAD-binding oxidoreductase [Candidatus Omnitrophota bacterium]
RDNMDLIDLFIGSEGTLGIISSLELALQNIPFGVFDGLLFFPQEEEALQFTERIKVGAQNFAPLQNPAALEFLDQNSLNLLRREYSFMPKAGGTVYFEQEAENKEEYDALVDKWQGLIETSGAFLDQSIFAETAKEREKVYQIRHKLPQLINEFLRRAKQVKAAADIAVPESNFKQMHQYYRKVSQEAKLSYLNFGHIGESHLHFNFLPQTNSQSQLAKSYLKELCRLAVSLGGTVSAEHGIGKLKKAYLEIMYSQDEINQMAALKKYFDPQCLLGLDNIFSKDLLGTGPSQITPIK